MADSQTPKKKPRGGVRACSSEAELGDPQKVRGDSAVSGATAAGAAYAPSAPGPRPRPRGEKVVTDLPPDSEAPEAPKRSTTEQRGAKGRSVMRSVGIDLGANKNCFCEVSGGEVIDRTTVRSIESLKDRLGPDTPQARVAIEACREAWYVHDLLTEWGHQVVIVDTTRTRQIGVGHHRRKNDWIDAEALARAVEKGTIPAAHVLSPERRELRHWIEVRRTLVETRTRYVTTVRGITRAQGCKLGSCAAEDFVAKVAQTELDEKTEEMNAPLLCLLPGVEEQLARVELKIEELCAQEPAVAQLATAHGVGLIVAASFVSVIDDAKRFDHAHKVQSYLGLVPGECTTGGNRRLGAITKQGNRYLRSMLIQAAWCVLNNRHPDPLAEWGRQVEARRGRRIAVVAVARRLTGILWAMWRDGTVYDPRRLGRASARGVALAAQKTQFQAAAIERAVKKTQVRTKRAEALKVKEGAMA